LDWALILSAAMMGLAGTPHCVAMCGAACTAMTGGQGASGAWPFHLGRLLSYSIAGGVAAASVGSLVAFGQAVAVLRPFWTLLHVAALGLGLWLLWQGRQPAWMERMGRTRSTDRGAIDGGWKRIRGPSRRAAAGLAWVAWPCGLLQSALLVASLANRPGSGALAMGAFAVASSTGLVAGRAAWQRATSDAATSALASSRWLVRFGGLVLASASAWALGHDLWMRFYAWCVA
jgi:sulfite exporter TauE/SafE